LKINNVKFVKLTENGTNYPRKLRSEPSTNKLTGNDRWLWRMWRISSKYVSDPRNAHGVCRMGLGVPKSELEN